MGKIISGAEPAVAAALDAASPDAVAEEGATAWGLASPHEEEEEEAAA